MGACSTVNAPLGMSCNDMGGKVCNGGGVCVACNVTGDCMPPNVCVQNQCVAPTCMDGMQDGNETDVDCGGNVCVPCQAGKKCLVPTDCASMSCVGNICQ